MTPRPSNIPGKQQQTLLSAAIAEQKPIFRKAIFFSVITSVLVLSPTLFMLEVYDRVVNSRSDATLYSLLICLVGVYVLMEVLEMLRGRLLYQAGWRIDTLLRERIHDATFLASLRHGATTTQSFNDLRTLREFIASPAVTAMMDAPSSVLFLVLVTIISPWLGAVALIGALVQVMIGISTERKTMPVLTEANQAAIIAQNYAGGVLRNAQVISAMGMKNSIYQRWIGRQRKFLALQAVASDTAGSNAATSKFIQTMQGSLILGLSCWLTVKGMLLGGGGMMIVASTLGGRVLSPLVQLIAQWRLVVNARDSYHRLNQFLAILPPERESMPLQAPVGRLSVEAVVAAAPGTNNAIIKGVSFALQPGETLMIIGPSAAGKTTLARLLMGIWPAASGKVRLDGADLHAWNKDELGPHLGYLPQTVELFDGTLAENIARFGDIDMNQVRAATELVGLGSMVDALPYGFDSRIGDDGSILSGGQRQRVGLARAIYGDPNFVLLDEPNSNLDEAGEQALLNTLMSLRARNCTTIVITHRTSVLPAADKILLLRDGQVAAFGPRDEVLAALKQPNAPRPVAAPNDARIAHAAGGAA
jgi:ATP-binding cassette subfamily C exporter for protease/lipase